MTFFFSSLQGGDIKNHFVFRSSISNQVSFNVRLKDVHHFNYFNVRSNFFHARHISIDSRPMKLIRW